MSALIEFKNVYKIYQSGEVEIRALDDASFTVEKGELCVVVGQSGAGKTTLLNIMGGIDRATSGEVSLDGAYVTDFNKKQLTEYRRHDIGFVFQFYNLIQNLTALENVEVATEMGEDPLDPAETLASVGLSHRLKNFPAQLSGGEQQRVAIARALAKNPKLLLCDEPTGALDDETGKHILELLTERAKNTDMTVMLITHNSVIAEIANRVIRMKSGKITGVDTNEHPKPVSEIEW
ncbi:MAG: ABC transporter ATP-binding protein [Clostridiales Family XIII bacterium]|nr:ABC transporter ATP-binding protein [Clostridiales Family XIII bacterium]